MQKRTRKKRQYESHWNDLAAKCPYFKKHTGRTISCESPIPGSSLTLYFRTAKDKTAQYSIFCGGRYQNCEICRALNEAYDDE